MTLAYLLLGLAQLAGLALIPFGLPGLWLQAGALAAFAYWTDFAAVSVYTVGLVLFLALVAEIAELLLAGRYARRYGGGRRAGWGALLGGLVGAFAGIPIPLLGSVIGALIGSFVGATLLELTARRGTAPAVRAGWGALIGRIVAMAMKAGLGVVIAVVALFAALR